VNPPEIRHARLATIAMQTAVTATHAPCGAVYLRTLANALERHLQQKPESAVHWVSVINEADTFGPPSALWQYDDCLLQVSLAQGHSEGMLLHILAQPKRYEPGNVIPLFRVKVLCGTEHAARELHCIWEFLHSRDFETLKNVTG